MEVYSASCGSPDGRAVWGRTDTCIHMAESLCCSPAITAGLLTGYTPVQNKKLEVWGGGEWTFTFKFKKNVCIQECNCMYSNNVLVLQMMPYILIELQKYTAVNFFLIFLEKANVAQVAVKFQVIRKSSTSPLPSCKLCKLSSVH